MKTHIELGRRGEELAVHFLRLKDYEIAERNWRYQRAEIDIIAKKNDRLIFIEVKTRSTSFFGNPEEFVNRRKRALMARAAGAYIHLHHHEWLIRYDVVAVVLKPDNTYDIAHIEDAFF